jgi:N-acetylneuraminic acid mutarotase
MESVAQQTFVDIQWKEVGQLPKSDTKVEALGLGGPVAGVINNLFFIGGGSNFPSKMPWQGGIKKYYDHLYVFKKQADTLALLSSTFTLPHSIAYSANCTTSQGVFYGGGENSNGLSALTYLIHWNLKTNTPSIESLPPLPEPITNASATSLDQKVFIAGGDAKTGTSKKVWCLDLSQLDKGWASVADLPYPTSYSIFLTDVSAQKLILIGGRAKTTSGISELLKTVITYDIKTNSWAPMPDLPYNLSAGTGVMMKNGNFMLFGGERGTTFSKVEKLLQSILSTTDLLSREELVAQKNNLLINHPGFSREILFYHSATQQFELVGSMPFETPVTTIACWWENRIYIPSGEIKAGIRSSKIISATIKQ